MLDISKIWELINPQITENELVKILLKLSDQFTQSRDLLTSYPRDEKFVSAYSYFYLPTNMPKFYYLMDQLDVQDQEAISRTHFIDWGCGPGTFALSFLDFFKNIPDAKLSLIDSSDLMLSQAKRFIDHFYPSARASYHHHAFNVQGTKTLFFGHSLNEIGFEKGAVIIKEIDPEYVMIVEPGTKEVFSYINDLRMFMKRSGYVCLYPCPSIENDCPMISRADDWCHGIIHTTHDWQLERLSQLIKKDRRIMPHISHVYKKSSETFSKYARIIRLLNNSKFGFDLEVCALSEKVAEIKKIQILKKDLSKSQIKFMENMNIGIRIEYTLIKECEDFNRVKLIRINF